MAGLVVRIKSKGGQKVIDGLGPQDKVSKLRNKLSEVTGILAEEILVLGGFPPKPLDIDNENNTIEECGVVSGDTLIVQEKRQKTIEESAKEKEELANKMNNHIQSQESSARGFLLKKGVPADNSCLFTSIGFVLNGKVDTTCGSYMREIIANAVASDPDEFSEAYLGLPNAEYCEWILKPDAWGGGIELSILSRFYGLEIAVIDSRNAIINKFGEDKNYPQRVFLIFDGIHYDPLYMEPTNNSFGGSLQTIFPTDDEEVYMEAEQIAKEAQSSRQYTDVDKCTLKCLNCNVLLRGQVDAQKHAKETGHQSFGEVAS